MLALQYPYHVGGRGKILSTPSGVNVGSQFAADVRHPTTHIRVQECDRPPRQWLRFFGLLDPSDLGRLTGNNGETRQVPRTLASLLDGCRRLPTSCFRHETRDARQILGHGNVQFEAPAPSLELG